MLTNANFIYGSEVFRAATGLRHEDHHLIVCPSIIPQPNVMPFGRQ